LSDSTPRGIRRGALDAGFHAEEARKSELIIHAQLLRQAHDDEAAAQNFAQAAEAEERLGDACFVRGLLEKASLHRFSAASCWAQAGNLYRAIDLCDELLARAELSPSLRQRISDYAGVLRARRSEWYDVLLAQAAGAEA
jgi:hypothetical protein